MQKCREYKECYIPTICHPVKTISFSDLYVAKALLNLYLIALSPPVQEESVAFVEAASSILSCRPLAKETWSHLLWWGQMWKLLQPLRYPSAKGKDSSTSDSRIWLRIPGFLLNVFSCSLWKDTSVKGYWQTHRLVCSGMERTSFSTEGKATWWDLQYNLSGWCYMTYRDIFFGLADSCEISKLMNGKWLNKSQ